VGYLIYSDYIPSINMSLVFETALKEFKAGLTQEEKDDFKATDLGTLKQELSKMQKDQENRRSMMYMRRLEPFLTAMENYGKVIEVFLNTSDILAFVWVCGSHMASSCGYE
jgi:hypothetical protein